MAARDILTLEKSIAPQLLRFLYALALVLILLGTAWGVVRGVRIMIAPPPLPPAVVIAPGAAAPVAGPEMGQMARPMMGPGRPMMMRRRGFGRFRHMRGPGLMRAMPRPAVGAIVILAALLRGLIALLVVRVLTEAGLAVLSLKRD